MTILDDSAAAPSEPDAAKALVTAPVRPPRVTLISYHYLRSKRKAGFHWIADACHRMGWDVVFVTAPVSRLSKAGGNFRFEYPLEAEANRLVPVAERLSSYVHWTPFHPVHFRRRWLDAITAPVFGAYGRLPLGGLADLVAGSDVVIVESTPAVMLVPALRALNPSARIVYRVSDDFTFIPVHSTVPRAEVRVLDRFDLVSCASHRSVHRLGPDRVLHHPHGLATHLYDACTGSPYEPGTTNVVWVGTNSLDHAFLAAAARELPGWDFHVIGPVPREVDAPNVIHHGELPFESTIGWVKFADVALATFPPVNPAGEDLPDTALVIRSLKTTQYRYCGLPIVARADLAVDAERVFGYDAADPASVRSALTSALAAGVDPAGDPTITSWDGLTRTLLGTA